MKRRKGKKKPLDKLTRLQVEMRLKRALLDRDAARAEVAELTAVIKNGDALRQVGEHWYQLVAYFDANGIQPAPVEGGKVFAMGMLGDTIVMEVPEGTTNDDMARFTESLRARQITAPFLYVSAGVRFLKLASVSEELEVALDRKEEKLNAEAAQVADLEGTDVPRLGPEPTGDGLGDSQPPDVAGAGDGGDRDQAPDEAGEEAADGGGS